MIHVDDNAMSRKLFIEMLPTDQEAFLKGIRERRLTSAKKHEDLMQQKQIVKDSKTRELIVKEGAMMEKELLALDKAIDKVEKRAARLAALQVMVDAEQ
jgi:hypothetical protein